MKIGKILLITIAIVLLSIPTLLNTSKANSLGPSYLFFETMQIDTPSAMVLLFTPSTNFTSSELKILFPGSFGDWCKVGSPLNVSGVASSEIDVEGWSIDQALPGALSASCTQSVNGDYIHITGLGNLTGGVSYGLEIENNPTVFNNINFAGSHLVTVQLTEDLKTESTSFEINLLEDDIVLVSALVSDTVSINCTLETSNVNFGTLYRAGSYVSSSLDIVTQSTSSFYWAVYGTGGPATENAGLYNSEGSGYLISSLGVDGRVNLLTDEGFGMVVSTSRGTIPADFSPDSPGIFGSIGKASEQAKLFLHAETGEDTVYSQVTYGVKAGPTALTGNYNETLTYVCGGYVGN